MTNFVFSLGCIGSTKLNHHEIDKSVAIYLIVSGTMTIVLEIALAVAIATASKNKPVLVANTVILVFLLAWLIHGKSQGWIFTFSGTSQSDW